MRAPRSILHLALAACTLLACKGHPADNADGGAAEASKDSSPCRPGETLNVDPPLCYRLPAGMKPARGPIKKPGRFQLLYADANGGKISFVVWGKDAFAATWKALEANAIGSKATDVKKEALEGGAKQLTYTTPQGHPRRIASFVMRSTLHTLECEAEVHEGKSIDDLLAACKQMHDP